MTLETKLDTAANLLQTTSSSLFTKDSHMRNETCKSTQICCKKPQCAGEENLPGGCWQCSCTHVCFISHLAVPERRDLLILYIDRLPLTAFVASILYSKESFHCKTSLNIDRIVWNTLHSVYIVYISFLDSTGHVNPLFEGIISYKTSLNIWQNCPTYYMGNCL